MKYTNDQNYNKNKHELEEYLFEIFFFVDCLTSVKIVTDLKRQEVFDLEFLITEENVDNFHSIFLKSLSNIILVRLLKFSLASIVFHVVRKLIKRFLGFPVFRWLADP